MARHGGGSIEVSLACAECGARNYRARRQPERIEPIERSKHCPTCNKHTTHRESK